MSKIVLEKKDWDAVKQKVEKLNPEFYRHVEDTAKHISKPYLYEATIPFYVDIIDKGRTNLFNPDYLKGGSETVNSILSDFSGQGKQPLGFVSQGLVEVYNSNSYVYENFGDLEYTFPLRLFKEGEIFGTFEVMDFLSEYKDAKYSYSASSGHHSIYPLIPDPEKGTQKYKNRVGINYLENWPS